MNRLLDMGIVKYTLLTILALALAAEASPGAAGPRNQNETVVFTRFRKATGYDIWKIRGDGRGLKRLTAGSLSEVTPTFSPDGSRIAFVRQHLYPEPSTLWLMQSDGTNRNRLESNASAHGQLAWSPSGEEIVYVGSDDAAQTDLFIVDVSDSSVRQVTDTPALNEREPDWSPDATSIAYAAAPLSGGNLQSTYDIYTVDVGGGEPVQLTEHKRNDNRPKWSPDSTLIAFRSARDDSCDGCEDDYTSNIYVVNTDGSEETRVSDVKHSRTDWAEWSPDGQQLYFPVSYDDDAYTGPNSDPEIYSVRKDGTGLTNLTDNHKAEVTPLLSPDGRRVYLIRFGEERHQIVRLNLSNLETQVLERLRSAYPLGDVGPS